MPDNRKKLGDFGEQVALVHLTRHGLHEVARKWRCAAGEIDLVMREGAAFVFVEVRTRRDSAALESIGPRKQERLANLAYTYLERNQVAATIPWRIDVVGIQISQNGSIVSLDWVRDAIGALS